MNRPLLTTALSLIAISWLTFLLSFFLPASDVVSLPNTGESALTGWQAMVSSVTLVFLTPILWFAEPRCLLFFVFPFTNFTFLVLPIAVLWLRGDSWVLIPVMLTAYGIPFVIPSGFFRNLYIGFYLWHNSHLLGAVGVGLASYAFACLDKSLGIAEAMRRAT